MKVILTGDWHIGSPASSFMEIMSIKQKYWLGKPVILMGDLIDAGLDRGMQFDQEYNATEQIERVRRALKGLDIRSCLIGNHEQRIFRQTGLELYKILGYPELHYVEIDNCSFYVTHGRSGAKNPLTEFTKLFEFVDADIIAIGHSHDLGVWNKVRGRTANGEGRRVVLVRTGSFLEGAAYSLQNGYAPKIKGFLVVDTKKKTAQVYSLINGKVMKI